MAVVKGAAMLKELYKYQFSEGVSLRDIEETLLLAVLAAESLHGQSRVRLDAGYCIEEGKRACVIDAATDVGRDICRLFTGFAMREFGEDAFRVDRIEVTPDAAPQEAVRC
jgi:hypothetical protein